MARLSRIESYPGLLVHLISRGVEQRPIFLDEADRRRFMSLLLEAFRASSTALLAYCLMGNHFHVLAELSDAPVTMPMHFVLTRYAQYFNWKYSRVGHLFQDRFKAIPCLDLSYLDRLIWYIHDNPVRARLVQRPCEWAWSSCGEYIGGGSGIVDWPRLEKATGMSRAGLRMRCQETSLFGASGGGSRPIATMLRLAASLVGLRPEELAQGGKGEAFTRGRRLLAVWGTEDGYSLGELARAVNCSKSALSQLIR